VEAVYRIGLSTMKVVSCLRHAVIGRKFAPWVLSRADARTMPELKYSLMKKICHG
jgi:hypothetical protein